MPAAAVIPARGIYVLGIAVETFVVCVCLFWCSKYLVYCE